MGLHTHDAQAVLFPEIAWVIFRQEGETDSEEESAKQGKKKEEKKISHLCKVEC